MATQIIKTTFRFRRGLAAEWTEKNPTLSEGEPGFELDTNQIKIGDGVKPWNELEYLSSNQVVANAVRFRDIVNDLSEIDDPIKGDFVLVGTAEYIYNGSDWVLMGDEGVYATLEGMSNLKEQLEQQIQNHAPDVLSEEEIKAICI